jgi:hypothetical protein
MERYHVRQSVRKARLSSFEEQSFVTGILLLVTGTVVAMVHDDPGGSAGLLGKIGLGLLGVCALSRGVRLYRANVAASMPQSVGRVGVRIRPRRVSTAITVAFALFLPAAASVALRPWRIGGGWLSPVFCWSACLQCPCTPCARPASLTTRRRRPLRLCCWSGSACGPTFPFRTSSSSRVTRRTLGRREVVFTSPGRVRAGGGPGT